MKIELKALLDRIESLPVLTGTDSNRWAKHDGLLRRRAGCASAATSRPRIAAIFRTAALAIVSPLLVAAPDSYASLRESMVREQIESRGVRDRAVMEVMKRVPRHQFVPAAIRSWAYADRPLPIGHGATISQPYIVALMTELLEVRSSHRVLEIGTGSGYQAAILARLSKHVYTIELEKELAREATQRLTRLGYANVTVRHGDGYRGWPEESPFDRIIVTAAPPELPAALIDQLAPGGKLVAPVGSGWDQELILVSKAKDGTVHRESKGGVRFVPMRPQARVGRR